MQRLFFAITATFAFSLLGALAGCGASASASQPAVTGQPASRDFSVLDRSAGLPVLQAPPNGSGATDKNATPEALSEAEAKKLAAALETLARAATVDDAYAAAQTVEDLGQAAVPELLARMSAMSTPGRIAALRALHTLGKWDDAIKGLCDTVSAEGEREHRIAAAELLGVLASPRHDALLSTALDAVFDTPVKVELALALWNSSKANKAKDVLNELLKSTSEGIQLQAALALGRLGDLSTTRDIIEKLADEPTLRGQLAAAILRRERTLRQLERAMTDAPKDPKALIKVDTSILGTLTQMIDERYIYADRKEARRLMLAAVSGLTNSLDPYSVYLDESQQRRASDIRLFHVPSLGLALGAAPFRSGRKFRVPTVVAVTAGSPAEAAGLRPGDQILNTAPQVSVERVRQWRDGAPRKLGEIREDFLESGLGNCVQAMFGNEGESIALMVRRSGWKLTRWVHLTHRTVEPELLHFERLDGGLAYVAIRQFSADTPARFEAALKTIAEEKLKGLLLDLRDCPNGALNAGVMVAGMLLPKGALIASSAGRNDELVPRTEHRAEVALHNETLPVTLIVNGGTADTAEVVAAALQEHQRAEIVGSRTFGRAILQNLIPLEAEDRKHALLLTVGRISTPVSKRVLYDTGVMPDRAAKAAEVEGWVLDELDDLRFSGRFDSYVESLVKAEGGVALKLAVGDGGSVETYPGWEAFRKGQENHLSSEQLRHEVRAALRRALRLSGELKETVDFQADEEFSEALKTLAAKVAVDLRQFDRYKWIGLG